MSNTDNKTEQNKQIMALESMCRALKIPAFFAATLEQERNPEFSKQGFLQRLQYILQAEIESRHEKRQARMLKESAINDVLVGIDKISFEASRGLDEGLIMDLACCYWIEQTPPLNVIITGKTGCGKSWLAKALGKEAVKKGLTTLYMRAPQLLEKLTQARAESQIAQYRRKLNNRKLVIIDDFAMTPMTDQLKDDFLSFLDERRDYGSLLIASQRRFEDWYKYLGDGYHADAIMDRLKNSSYMIELKGRSLREQNDCAQKIREFNEKVAKKD